MFSLLKKSTLFLMFSALFQMVFQSEKTTILQFNDSL